MVDEFVERRADYREAERSSHGMTYQQSLDYLNSLIQFGIRPQLDRIAALADAFGNPHQQLRVIHVTGTNGKGSDVHVYRVDPARGGVSGRAVSLALRARRARAHSDRRRHDLRGRLRRAGDRDQACRREDRRDRARAGDRVRSQDDDGVSPLRAAARSISP